MAFDAFGNPRASHDVPAAGFAPESRDPMHAHATMDGFAATRLVDCPSLADRLGVASVLVKDESSRLGLPSFKILGASWAVLETIRRRWLGDRPGPLTVAAARAELGDGDGRRLVAATDGNHGRGVARMAGLLGLDCLILVPEGTADARIAGIAAEGADVRVVAGSYDDAVAESARLDDDAGLVISDTSWPGYEQTPRAVIEGYSTMFHEVDDATAARGLEPPTLLAIQAGVGAFAAAGLRHYRRPGRSVRTVLIEPSSANCLMASARAGHPAEVPGPHRSAMAGLNCGLPSPLAWPIVDAATDWFVAIDDPDAFAAMKALAEVGVVAGESGAAALGGLMAIADRSDLAARIGLTVDARVLLVNTEGATDPENYRAIVGRGHELVEST